MRIRVRMRIRVHSEIPSSLSNMRVIGIDPGLATIGIGVIDAISPDAFVSPSWLTIETASGIPTSERLKEIHDDLLEVLREMKPALAVVERIFFAVNERTVIDVAQARGVILLTLAEQGIPVLEPSPLELKRAITGDGSADKRQMQDMLVRMLHLPAPPKPDDAADALALAIFGALSSRTNSLIA